MSIPCDETKREKREREERRDGAIGQPSSAKDGEG
jgi:hypothetical protein